MCDRCDWQEAIDRAEDLIERGSYVLPKIRDWIEEHEHVTPEQEAAIACVEEAFDDRDPDR